MTRMGGERATAGYTLLELLVALAIMSLIAVVAIPAVAGSLERMTLSSDARALTTQLRRLREDALDRQIDITVAPSGAAENVLDVSGGDPIALASGTHAEIVTANGAPPRFAIGWDGTMTGAIRLSRGNAVARIVADRLTGRLSVEVGQ